MNIKERMEEFSFNLQSELFLTSSNYKKCSCDIVVNGECIVCGPKKGNE